MKQPDGFQRLDVWLWCARFARSRAECGVLVTEGRVRLNRQPTDKPHAKLRLGDVLTLAARGEVLVLRVLALAGRRGPASEARALYEVVEAAVDAVAEGAVGEAGVEQGGEGRGGAGGLVDDPPVRLGRGPAT